MNDNIKKLQEQIEVEKRKIANCKHIFDKPYYDPETTKEAYGYKMVAQGSDIWGEPEGYREVQKPRWARKCQICGNIEYTYSQKPIISGHEPSF